MLLMIVMGEGFDELIGGQDVTQGCNAASPVRAYGRQGTAATASPNMIIASRNMTTVEIKKLTIGCILVEQVFSTPNEKSIDWIHCLKGQVSDLNYCNAENRPARFRD